MGGIQDATRQFNIGQDGMSERLYDRCCEAVELNFIALLIDKSEEVFTRLAGTRCMMGRKRAQRPKRDISSVFFGFDSSDSTPSALLTSHPPFVPFFFPFLFSLMDESAP